MIVIIYRTVEEELMTQVSKFPILPSKGDFVEINNNTYIVGHILWKYIESMDEEEAECPEDTANTKVIIYLRESKF